MVGPGGLALPLPREAVVGVQDWLKETRSTTLWVEGPAGVPYPSGVSTTALYVSDLFAAAEIPCIAFFPKSRCPGTSAECPQQRVLLNLLYSLLRQLINILPRVFTNDNNAMLALDKQRFDKLDGTVDSIEPAMELIRDLLPLAPQRPLVVVVNGLQLAESRRPETRTALNELVLLLQEQQQQLQGLVKLLFTTDGQSQVLGRVIGFRERLDLSRAMVGARAGRPLRGASSLRAVSLASDDLGSEGGSSVMMAREGEKGAG